MKYVLAIDQSTQGTKALLLDERGEVVSRAAMPHRQIVDGRGYISHDLNEIWRNVLLVARECVGERAEGVCAVGISDQRETSCIWNDEGPLADAVVWQCARAKDILGALAPYAELVRGRTGLPLSPYFPAAKYAWLLKNTEQKGRVRLGTVDSFLVWRLTGNFYTDYSNASRTQLFNIHTLCWDEELIALFGVPMEALPEVKDSDGVFGYTDMGGVLPQKVPVCGVLGDSHAALFAEGCFAAGQGKVTYGTGSSVMMNVGDRPALSRHGLASSLAWKADGKVSYVLEGNINYSCAVITWLKELGLIGEAKEAGVLAAQADPEDRTALIPAFSGLSAPYWKPEARAALLNMSRTTGKKEICRAAEESIAFQIADILDALRADSGLAVKEIRADGGAAGDTFLMQTQADAAGAAVLASFERELSPLGAGRLAGISAGVYDAGSFQGSARRYVPKENARVKEARARWQECLAKL